MRHFFSHRSFRYRKINPSYGGFTGNGISYIRFFCSKTASSDGTTGGFRLLPWSSKHPLTATYQAEASDLFIKKSDTGMVKRLRCFQTTAITLLNEKTPLKCLDEIGGTELLVPEFLNALYALLESDICCVGVIKSLKI